MRRRRRRRRCTGDDPKDDAKVKRRSRRIACEKTISPHGATYGGEREGDEAQKPSKF